MSLSAFRSLSPRFGPVPLAVASVLISSFWIAICAATPEFIWQGLWIALEHPSRGDLLSALLIGLNLAFFIEPAMARLRDLLRRAPADHKPHNALFTAALSLAFALASICLDDAMTAFVSGGGAGHAADSSGVAGAIALTTAWAIVPFATTLAWQTMRYRRLAVPMGIIAGASPGIAGWLFSWSVQAVMTTAVPCWLILGFGYFRVMKEPRRRAFVRCVPVVAAVAVLWLVLALLVDAALALFHADQLRLYSAPRIFIDLRFYFGWALGLVLAPAPNDRAVAAPAAPSG